MEDEFNSDEIFEYDFIKEIAVNKVCEGFEKIENFDELKKNEVFRNLFKNIGAYVDLPNLDFESEDYTVYARDIFLLKEWNERMRKEGKAEKHIEGDVDRVAHFYATLLQYVGGSLQNLDIGNAREVFEVWIIKRHITPSMIGTLYNSLKRFYKFLDERGIENMGFLDDEEIEDLKRVANEFKQGVLELNNEDYTKWRERNIIYYM